MFDFIPEAHTAPPAARRRYIWRTLGLVTALLVGFVVFYGLGGGQPERAGLNLAMIVLLIVFVGAAAYEMIALIRSLDELQQRIHVLAWAIGFGIAVHVAFICGIAAHLGLGVRFDPMLVILVAVPGYYLSLFFVGRYYR